MRYAEEHKQGVRERLLRQASRLVRGEGIRGVSVSAVMAGAKMTVGGFYRHFSSQEALVSEALAGAFIESRALLLEGLEELRGAAFERALIDRYLSEPHFVNVEQGCPVAANVSELSRLSALASEPLLAEVRALVAHVAERGRGSGEREARAWVLLSCCVGGLALARALGPQEGRRVLGLIRRELRRGVSDGG